MIRRAAGNAVLLLSGVLAMQLPALMFNDQERAILLGIAALALLPVAALLHSTKKEDENENTGRKV